MTIYFFVNVDERYGPPVHVVLQDYRELNPSGDFWQDGDGIYERLDGEPFDDRQQNWRRIAKPVDVFIAEGGQVEQP